MMAADWVGPLDQAPTDKPPKKPDRGDNGGKT